MVSVYPQTKKDDHGVEISVIVPFLNEEMHIKQCIDSLLHQDIGHETYELIFVDNNSTDSSPEIVSRYPSVRLIHERTPNVYVARNTAIQSARGNILAFTDADCTVSTNWLSTFLREIDINKADCVLGERFFSPDASYMSRFMRDFENGKIECILKNSPFHNCFAFTNNMAIRRDIYDRLEGFREDIPLADTNFAIRYLRETAVPRISYCADARIHHLEIRTWRDWLRKLMLYGKASPKSDIGHEVSVKNQLEKYLFCIRKHHYSPLETVLFLFSAVSGNIAFYVTFLFHAAKLRLNQSVSNDRA